MIRALHSRRSQRPSTCRFPDVQRDREARGDEVPISSTPFPCAHFADHRIVTPIDRLPTLLFTLPTFALVTLLLICSSILPMLERSPPTFCRSHTSSKSPLTSSRFLSLSLSLSFTLSFFISLSLSLFLSRSLSLSLHALKLFTLHTRCDSLFFRSLQLSHTSRWEPMPSLRKSR